MMDEKEINFITLGYGQDQSRPIAQNNMPDFYRKEFTFDFCISVIEPVLYMSLTSLTAL